jgi:perosamine synthetase
MSKNKIKYPLVTPIIGSKEIHNVMYSLKSGWISANGSFVPKFEKLFSNYLGGGHAVAVSSGTTALQLSLATFGIGKGDQVIVPNFTFAATINSIIHSGAKPVLIDVENETWTIDLEKLKKSVNSSTKAIMIVHVYGQPCRIDEIKKFAKKKKLIVIEDCAEAIGAKYKKRLVGRDGDCSCFSFVASKTITTGEGGMVVFKDKKKAEEAKLLRSHGMSKKINYWHEKAGFNFRMTNIQAALGVAQILKIKYLINQRKKIFNYYNKQLRNNKKISLLPSNSWSENSYWLYTITINNIGEKKRNKILSNLRKKGIDTKPAFYSLNRMKPYKKYGYGSYVVSNYLSKNSLSLPSSKINKSAQDYIVKNLLKEVN